VGASETQWWLTRRSSALLIRLVGAIATVVVPIAHELSWHTNRVATLELERTTLSSIRVVLAMQFVASIRTVSSSIAPLVVGDAGAVVTLPHAIGAFS
jgi:hypothetical protein